MLNALFLKELRELAATRSFWVMLLVLCPLVGFSFIEAVFLYAHAGESIMGDDILMARLSPLDGIVVPTFSALYLSEVFLFPFVAIRLLGVERQFGSIKLLNQICPWIGVSLAVKLVVVMLAYLASFLPALTALAVWRHLGGYLHIQEVSILLLGHFLFALLIASIAFFAVAITDSPQTAAIVTLAFTISSWVLEFAGQNQSTLNAISWLSMTAHLRLFEAGLFSLQTLLGFLIASASFVALAAIWLRAADDLAGKFKHSAILAVFVGILAVATSQAFYYKDFSENRENSFHPRNEAELRKLNKPLVMTIHLSPDDSIAVDFEKEFLSKLKRVVRDVKIVYELPKDPGPSGQEDPNYGLITYDYGGGRLTSHDVGARRALEVLHILTGAVLEGEVDSPYPGHPIRADASNYRILFYVIMPVGIILLWIGSQKILKRKR